MDYRPVGFHEFRKSTLNTDFKAYGGVRMQEHSFGGSHLLHAAGTSCLIRQVGGSRQGRGQDASPLISDFKGIYPIVSATRSSRYTQLIQSRSPEKISVVPGGCAFSFSRTHHRESESTRHPQGATSLTIPCLPGTRACRPAICILDL